MGSPKCSILYRLMLSKYRGSDRSSRVTAGCVLRFRCDVAVNGVKPAYCSPFQKFHGLQTMKDHLALAVDKIDRGFKFVIVSSSHRIVCLCRLSYKFIFNPRPAKHPNTEGVFELSIIFCQ